MFEKTRSDLVARLRHVSDRYLDCQVRAMDWQDKNDLAVELGLGGEPDPVLSELIAKTDEQIDLCAQAIRMLVVDRSFPFLLKGGVKRAEHFADQCEFYLAVLDDGERVGKERFAERFGGSQDQ